MREAGDGQLRLRRARLRGTVAVLVALFAIAIAGIAVPSVLAAGVPSGVVSIIVAAPFAVAAQAAWAEWRLTSPGAHPGPAAVPPGHRTLRRVAWVLDGLAVLVGALPAFVALTFAEMVSMPHDCAPIPPPGGGDAAHERHCAATTPAENAAFGTWCAIIGLTLVAVALGAVGARRSRVAVLAAPPVVFAGCLIAFDLARLAAAITGRG